MEQITLYNGVKMPIVGYGVYQISKEKCEHCVMDALAVGYRLIDTAQSYFNEEQVGNAILNYPAGLLIRLPRRRGRVKAPPALRCARRQVRIR